MKALFLSVSLCLFARSLPAQTPFADSNAVVIIVENGIPLAFTLSIRTPDKETTVGLIEGGRERPRLSLLVLPSAGLGALAAFTIVLTSVQQGDTTRTLKVVEREVGHPTIQRLEIRPRSNPYQPAMYLSPILTARVTPGLHVDEQHLQHAAEREGVPTLIMLGIAAVESGYRGGNWWLGKAGEIGRVQIQQETANANGCRGSLSDYHDNISCGARILKRCHAKYGTWENAVRCFNGPALPDGTYAYLEKVKKAMSTIMLARLNLWRAN